MMGANTHHGTTECGFASLCFVSLANSSLLRNQRCISSSLTPQVVVCHGESYPR
jgi:hypothetical protein